MKYKIILLLIVISITSLHSQTIEMEKKNLNEMVDSGEFSNTELATLRKSWTSLLDHFGEYPDLPFNKENNRVEFIKVKEYPGQSKSQIYKRTKEWIAINYGSIQHVLHYEDTDHGKIIVKGFFELYVDDIYKSFWGNPKQTVRSIKCYHTAVFTISDSKQKIEFTNVNYKARVGGYSVGSTYIPYEVLDYSIQNLYPITSKAQESWVSGLSTLENTTKEMYLTMDAIERYINSAAAYDKF